MLPLSSRAAWIGTGCLAAILCLTLLSVLSHVAWNPYLELTSHFKVQFFVASLLMILGVLLRSAKREVLIALFCLAIQLAELLPWYLPPAWATAPPHPNVRILLANLYVRNQNPRKILELIATEQPDLIVIQEKSPAWLEALTPLRQDYSHFFQAPEDIALFSRIPLQNPTLIGEVNQFSIAATITIAGQSVAIVATHPLPPRPDLAQFRNTELQQVANHITQQTTPVILLGDLNATMWSPYYKQLEQTTGLKNARRGFGILPTWPAPTPYARTHPLLAQLKPLLWIPIDHCLVSSEIQVRSLRPGPNIDSDHLPLIADLLIPNSPN